MGCGLLFNEEEINRCMRMELGVWGGYTYLLSGER